MPFSFFQAEGRAGKQSFCAMATDRAQPAAYGKYYALGQLIPHRQGEY